MPDLTSFYRKVLAGAGVPVTPQAINNFAAWQKAEGGWTNNAAAFNPLNTTRGSQYGSMNSVGVRVYPNEQTGVQQTIDTLRNGNYGGILSSFGAPTAQFAQAVYASPWGTKHGIGGTAAESSTAPSVAAAASPSPAPVFDRQAFALGQLADIRSGTYSPQKALSSLALTRSINRTYAGQPIEGSPGLTYPPLRGAPAHPAGADIVKEAYKWLGTPYSWAGGGTGGPSRGTGRGANTVGFDCSGFLQYLWGKQGIAIPRVTYDQWRTGTAIPKQALKPGDAVFFHPGASGPEHVGMYIGNDQFVQAPHTGDVVKISQLSSYGGYMGARRYS